MVVEAPPISTSVEPVFLMVMVLVSGLALTSRAPKPTVVGSTVTVLSAAPEGFARTKATSRAASVAASMGAPMMRTPSRAKVGLFIEHLRFYGHRSGVLAPPSDHFFCNKACRTQAWGHQNDAIEPPFGNPAISQRGVPWLCILASRRVCRFVGRSLETLRKCFMHPRGPKNTPRPGPERHFSFDCSWHRAAIFKKCSGMALTPRSDVHRNGDALRTRYQLSTSRGWPSWVICHVFSLAYERDEPPEAALQAALGEGWPARDQAPRPAPHVRYNTPHGEQVRQQELLLTYCCHRSFRA